MQTIRNCFVTIAADCPAKVGTVPGERGGAPSVPAIQHALLTAEPYRYDHEGLIWEVHRRHKGVAGEGLEAAAARRALLSRSHPCMRASALPKRYGWGVHYDDAGRIAIYGAETERYRELAAGPAVVPAMRSRRG
ncbi:hypothetical protein OPKNFCMD_1307 [Methylobacterium crusticola]|uniref:Uncharacterized protein n=1 Tax=Methylobacterium crusticola TaxID=1697972 RepID=A0ABQ4QTN4_9HYPH|nr:DUF6157 family protein [Methylobacterium crusticola]GJD48584.1 hypothetical protein OPKNFCMD_1307 [Methylobacterium crusticola]